MSVGRLGACTRVCAGTRRTSARRTAERRRPIERVELMLAPRMTSRIAASVLRAGTVAAAATETFDEAWQRLQQGVAYTAQPTGIVRMSHRLANGTEYH